MKGITARNKENLYQPQIHTTKLLLCLSLIYIGSCVFCWEADKPISGSVGFRV